ncbi:MAG: hypothetical protein COA96_03080 [SAR86 cluster bacterium]|uniref:Alpha/beta hydrolase n=1 Tax=SAR86 cluster bacterium TaxID=2030880 RepID=A0A2A5B7E3_9GAMM|nr:MAG: hypothetical protein COA96_03080 [SAR86 cluster bacterium]
MQYSTTTMSGLFDAEYFDIESSHVNDTFRIFVGKPSIVEPQKSYPAIYSLDGNASFASMIGTQRLLSQGGEVPPSFVIGIGYPGESLAVAMANRNRDYVPTEPEEYEIKSLGASVQAGGPAFLRFLSEELKPLIEKKYPVGSANSTLQGVSLGGLFATWTLLTSPNTFDKYILGSPAIWWRKEQVWEWEEAFSKTHDDMQATVFISAGALEVKEHIRASAVDIAKKNPEMRAHIESFISFSDENGWPRIAELTVEFASRLQSRNYPGLKIHCHNMPDENHMSAPPAITSRGLRFVNGSWHPEK